VQSKPERETWAVERCKVISTALIFGECRKRVDNYLDYERMCQYDACGYVPSHAASKFTV
jgi:hypothetical protein